MQLIIQAFTHSIYRTALQHIYFKPKDMELLKW